MTNQTCDWDGETFEVLTRSANWSNSGGVYIFAGMLGGYWNAFYIGSTESFADRIPSHERWYAASRRGATHVHVKSVARARTRQDLERRLIRAFEPDLNTRYW